jgi:hypothetical protein
MKRLIAAITVTAGAFALTACGDGLTVHERTALEAKECEALGGRFIDRINWVGGLEQRCSFESEPTP